MAMLRISLVALSCAHALQSDLSATNNWYRHHHFSSYHFRPHCPTTTTTTPIPLVPERMVLDPRNTDKTNQCNWGGVNSYLLYALPEDHQDTILSDLQSFGLKAVRVWVAGVDKNAKGTGSPFVPHFEPKHMGEYDYTVLNMIDKLMLKAQQYGIKLIIALHDRYALGCWSCDGYQKDLKLKCLPEEKGFSTTGCTSANDGTKFYQDENATKFYDQRLETILNHTNPYFKKKWSELKEVVAMFEIQNEAQGLDSSWVSGWHCARANVMRKLLHSEILIGTGGGRAFADSSRPEFFNCTNIDVVTLHDYNAPNWTDMYNSIEKARDLGMKHGKKVVHEEFGTKDRYKRPDLFYAHISAAADLGVPFMPWEYVIPGNTDGHDLEFDDRQAAWPVVVYGALLGKMKPASFEWSNLELCNVS